MAGVVRWLVGWWKSVVSLCVAAAFWTWGFWVCGTLETMRRVRFTEKPHCVEFGGLVGAGDLVHIEGKLFMVASDDRRGLWIDRLPSREVADGALYAVHMEGSDLYPLVRTEKVVIENFPRGVAFHPHGAGYNPRTRELFVVNHAYDEGGERVDIFLLKDPEEDTIEAQTIVAYTRSVTSTLFPLGSLDSIQPLPKGGFVVSTSRLYADSPTGRTFFSEALHTASLLLFQQNSKLLHCNDTDCLTAIDTMHLTQGVALDSEGLLWVSDVISKSIGIYDPPKKPRDGFVKVDTLRVPHSITSIRHSHEANEMILHGPPRLADAFEWQYHNKPSPSSTLIAHTTTKRITKSLVLRGDLLSGTSTAVAVPGTSWAMYGSWADRGILLCELIRVA